MKHPIKSKMIVTNAIIAGLAALESNYHILREIIPASDYLFVVIVVSVVNVCLRFITKTSVGFKNENRL